MLKYYQFRRIVKYVITSYTPKLLSSSIRMSGKSMDFGNKKNLKSEFYKNKNVIKLNDIDVNKILVFKEETHGSKNLLNTLLAAMMMIYQTIIYNASTNDFIC